VILDQKSAKKDAFSYALVMATVLRLISFSGFLHVKLSKLPSCAEESYFFLLQLCYFSTTNNKKIKSSLLFLRYYH